MVEFLNEGWFDIRNKKAAIFIYPKTKKDI